ncbi:MAG: vesicle-associated membrane protein 7B [Harvfovirus sp.]|uniref:Vesicle-associated membrane protein 7B n=1 Tax=Harvfovirus sp. TaxID=2487768 RepID=A0A3G5A0E7_9VIRU|nr:MAG: vesicle-associated membrane protein 7B [Harvfovirus sp.]
MSTPAKASEAKLKSVQLKIDDVKVAVQENVALTLKRGEHIDDVEGKSIILEEESRKFKKQSEELARKMWWRNFRLKAMITGLILAVLIIIILIAIYSK